MNEVIYSTKDECLKAIQTLKAIGMEPLPWMLAQLKAFEDAENAENAKEDSICKKVFMYGIATCVVIAVCVLLFASIGFVVFFLPLLAGVFAKK